MPSQLEAELVDCSSLGSVDMFFVGGDVATSVGSRRTELLGTTGKGGRRTLWRAGPGGCRGRSLSAEENQ